MKSRLISVKRIIEQEVGHSIDAKSRKRSHTYARAVYCKIAREMGGNRPHSLSEIGQIINRDHSTVLHTLRVVFPFAMGESSFKLLYLTLKAIFVDSDQEDDSFDQVKTLSERLIGLEKDNAALRGKLDLLRFGNNRFESLVDGLSKEELDEVYEKMGIFVRAIKSRVYSYA